MHWDAFKKFFIYYFVILLITFSIIELWIYLFDKPKPHLQELLALFVIVLIVSFSMGCLGSYLSRPQTTKYSVNNITEAINSISKSLNKSSYTCNSIEEISINNEIVYSSSYRIEKYYGKVYVKVCNNDTVEVKAAKIVFIKYINKLKL